MLSNLVGHVIKEADDKIVIFGEHDYRFDVPKCKITFVGRNVILGIDWDELFKYKVDRNSPLPGGQSIEASGSEGWIWIFRWARFRNC